MTPDQLFQIANALVLPAWLLLIIVPYWKWTGRITVGVVVTLLAILYTIMIAESLESMNLESFGSLEGVMQLFTERQAVLAGWMHYLAFDLMVGWFIVNDGVKHKLNRFLLIPCLCFTFILGPFGLLLYFLLRLMSKRKYFLEHSAQAPAQRIAPKKNRS